MKEIVSKCSNLITFNQKDNKKTAAHQYNLYSIEKIVINTVIVVYVEVEHRYEDET